MNLCDSQPRVTTGGYKGAVPGGEDDLSQRVLLSNSPKILQNVSDPVWLINDTQTVHS